jgi:plastocyanin
VDVSVFYYLTVAGQKPKIYQMSDGPNIVVHQGDVEEWTIENRAQEDHVFHIHQIHFRVLERDGQPVNDGSLLDTIDVPYWNGSGPYPSVKLRMSFEDPKIVGTFLYHCHILKHEDMGMMGKIEVLPPGKATSTRLGGPVRTDVTSNVSFTAEVRRAGGRAMPEGTVQFFVDGMFAGQSAVQNGRASFSTLFGLPGEHTITALYSGTTEYDESTGHPLQITVTE